MSVFRNRKKFGYHWGRGHLYGLREIVKTYCGVGITREEARFIYRHMFDCDVCATKFDELLGNYRTESVLEREAGYNN